MTAGTEYGKLNEDALLDDFYVCLHTAHRSMESAFELRAAAGLTQDDLATMLGVDKALISRRLNGVENMTLRVMSFMGTAMQCRVRVSFEPYENVGTSNFFNPTPSAQVGSSGALIYAGGDNQKIGTPAQLSPGYDKVLAR
jgi:transcriptional regulator with XRE-family HTH domain